MTSRARPTIAVLHQHVPPEALPDERDVLVEVEVVCGALLRLGFRPVPVPVTLDLERMLSRLRRMRPRLGFNLVESLGGEDSLLHVVPLLLDSAGIRYSGENADSLFLVTHKGIAKRLLAHEGIPTPAWMSADKAEAEQAAFAPPYILKHMTRNGSVGLDAGSIFGERESLAQRVSRIPPRDRANWFVEQYIDGREFNISLIADSAGPRVLPPAEIVFTNYPSDRPKLVGYRAKWEVDSFEYRNTVRSFDFAPSDDRLIARIVEVSIACWHAFGLRAFARVDLRVDRQGKPWVLEVNANPCISPDSGFVAALRRAGLSFEDFVGALVRQATP